MQTIPYLRAAPMSWAGAAGLLAMAASACLLAGFLTPAAGLVAASASVAVALSLLPPLHGEVLGAAPASWLVATMTATVVLLGPGAYSVDSRLFGRREVVIPVHRDRGAGSS